MSFQSLTFKQLMTERDKIVSEHLDLVHLIVRTIQKRYRTRKDEYDDLIQSGCLGLLDAMNKWSPDKECSFKSYASIRIFGSVIDFIRDGNSLGRLHSEEYKRIDYANSILNALGKETNSISISKNTNISEERIDKLRLEHLALESVSIDEIDILTKQEKNSLIKESFKKPNSLDLLLMKERDDFISEILLVLSQKESKVFQLYYYQDMTLREIGKVMSFTESRASQLLKSGIKKIRESIPLI